MNYEHDNVSSQGMSIDELVKLNGQAVEEMERIPYQPILYALPEEWLKADRALRQQAADFQPTLYKMIRPLATAHQIARMQDEQLQMFYQEKQEMMRAIQNSLQRDGRAREKHSSEISETLQSSIKSMEAVTSALDSRIRKLLVTTSVASAALSVLVCVVWHLLVG